MDEKGQNYIKKTIELNEKYRQQLKRCYESLTGENWDKAYIVNQEWAKAVNELKEYDMTLLQDIYEQFNPL